MSGRPAGWIRGGDKNLGAFPRLSETTVKWRRIHEEEAGKKKSRQIP